VILLVDKYEKRRIVTERNAMSAKEAAKEVRAKKAAEKKAAKSGVKEEDSKTPQ